jgi:periplasmic divalent cation tolerance protein
MDAIFCWVMCADEAEALRIGRTVVQERLAACANLLPGSRSVYWWQGKLEESTETVLVLKTRRALFSSVSERVAGLHRYETPCVIGLPLVEGHAPYLDWITQQSKGVQE